MAKNNKNRKKKNNLWGIVVLILLIATSIALIYTIQNKDKEDETTLAYTELIKQISDKNIAKVEMTTGSTSIKVTLGQEIKDGNKVEDGIKYLVEKELGIELVDDIKVKIEANTEEDPWDEIVEEDNSINNITDSYIEESI